MIDNDKPRMDYGYAIITAAFIMMMVIWGTFNTFGVFFEPLIKEFGWTRTIASGASALNNIILGICAIMAFTGLISTLLLRKSAQG